MNLLAPLRFQFTEPDDAKMYGGDWYVYDEQKIMRLPAREQVKLEQQLGMPLIDVMREMRRDTVMGRLATTWLAIHLADPDTAGEFDDYTPLVMFVVWHPVPDAAGESMAGPLDPADSATSPSSPPTG